MLAALMAEQKGLRFDLERLTDLPSLVEVDATRLRQVLWNLISNAMKFTKEGGVVMTVSAECDEQHTDITIEVEDTGIGIPEAEQEKIFAMYYQVKSGKDNLHAVGTGIGLAVSRQLIKLMGGDISVNSEEGFGSTFTVTMRVPLLEEAPFTEEPQESQTQLNIFMVEDIELNITVARSLLESMGHKVTVAMTGEDAIQRFTPTDYDLVFLDIQLPDMTGFDIAQYYRAHYTKLPPLVALTANVLKDKEEYRQKGMDAAISKPLSVAAVREVIGKVTHDLEDDADLHDPSLIQKTQDQDIYQQLLDLEMLQSYVEIVGAQPVIDSVTLFEHSMPAYLEVLDSNMVAKDKEGIVGEAHKIKGAAGSVGLKRIQKIAQKAQSPEAPAWWENISDWVEEIKNEYQSDIVLLKQWLSQQVGSNK